MDIKRRAVTCQSKSKVSGGESGIGEVRNSRGEEKWRQEVSRECGRWSEAGVVRAMRGRGGGKCEERRKTSVERGGLVGKCMTRENNKGEGRRKLGIRTGEWEGGNRCVNELVRMGKVWRAIERDERKWVCTNFIPPSQTLHILQYKQHTTKKRFC